MKDIVIIGAGGFGREVAWLIEDINRKLNEWNLLGFIDENTKNHGKILNGFVVLGGLEWFSDNEDVYYVCAVGNPKTKKDIIERCSNLKIKAATLIHPSVIMSTKNDIGEGCIVCASNIITVNVYIGNHVIINLDCTIGHDAVIDDYCTILPSTNVSGNVTIGNGCEIGTGSAIIQGIIIASDSILGAGAVVINNINETGTYVGVPARKV